MQQDANDGTNDRSLDLHLLIPQPLRTGNVCDVCKASVAATVILMRQKKAAASKKKAAKGVGFNPHLRHRHTADGNDAGALFLTGEWCTHHHRFCKRLETRIARR